MDATQFYAVNTPVALMQSGNQTKNKMDLLQKARTHKLSQYGVVSEDKIALAVTWAKDEISLGQVCHALGVRTGNTVAYVVLARALREYIRRNK